MIIWARLLLVALLLGISTAGLAHEFRLSIVEARAQSEATFNVRFSPSFPHLELALDSAPGCALTLTANADAEADRPGLYTLTCPEDVTAPTLRITAPAGMPLGEVMVRTFRPGHEPTVRTQRGAEAIAVAPLGDEDTTGSEKSGTWAVAKIYGVLGVEHILFGFDHLLFVLGLLLLVRGPRTLFLTITAFTLAHSVTLALSVLGLVTLSPAPVEAVIALSILLLAIELTGADTARESWTRRAPWSAALLFGLLHGFGFAGALTEIGLPEGQRATALAAFNIGVELGQLLFVAALVLLHRALLRRLSLPALRLAAAYLLGSLSVAWVLERLGNVLG